MYVKHVDDNIIVTVLHVDDLIITGIQLLLIQNMKSELQKQFEMTDLGILHYFAGLQIWHMEDGIFLSQPKYVADLLACFHMSDCKPGPTPFQSGVKLNVECTTPFVDATLYPQLVGSLIYLTHNRPYVSFVVSIVSRSMQQPHEIHWQEANRILIYLQGALYYGVFYSSSATVLLSGYTDSNQEGDSYD